MLEQSSSEHFGSDFQAPAARFDQVGPTCDRVWSKSEGCWPDLALSWTKMGQELALLGRSLPPAPGNRSKNDHVCLIRACCEYFPSFFPAVRPAESGEHLSLTFSQRPPRAAGAVFQRFASTRQRSRLRVGAAGFRRVGTWSEPSHNCPNKGIVCRNQLKFGRQPPEFARSQPRI